jgi:diacylglycerol kinase family enzyme
LTGQRRLVIDVGVVEYQSEGKSSQRFFVNEADAGFGAAVMEASKDIPARFGRTMNYALVADRGFRSLFSHQNKWVTLRADNETEDVCISITVVANGRYFGGGMDIAPEARLDDGFLDMVVIGDVGRSELMKIWPMTYIGSHVRHPKIRVRKVTSVTIESSERVPVEADGEILGECPVSFRVMPSALTVVV